VGRNATVNAKVNSNKEKPIHGTGAVTIHGTVIQEQYVNRDYLTVTSSN
jgi:hypothetical protein